MGLVFSVTGIVTTSNESRHARVFNRVISTKSRCRKNWVASPDATQFFLQRDFVLITLLKTRACRDSFEVVTIPVTEKTKPIRKIYGKSICRETRCVQRKQPGCFRSRRRWYKNCHFP